jgi:hypothetical protein
MKQIITMKDIEDLDNPTSKKDLVYEKNESAVKLTEWKNEPSYDNLKADFDNSKQSHDKHIISVNKWRDMHHVRNSYAPEKVKGRSSIQPKLIRRQAEWRYSALTEPFLSSDKLFDVKPVTYEDLNSAKQNELVLNWQFRTKINRVKFIDEYVRTNVDEGSAIIRIGWTRKIVTEEKEVNKYQFIEPTDEQEVAFLEQAINIKATDPRDYETNVPEELRVAVDFYEETGNVSVAVADGKTVEKVEKIIENKPTLAFVSPENFYFDPACNGDIEKAMFVIVSFETSKSELKKEPEKYKNLDMVDWNTSNINSDPDHVTTIDDNFNFRDIARKKVVAYEYWGYYDIEGNDTLEPIVATWINGTLIRLERNPFPDEKPPFVVTNYMPIKREVMGEPDAALLEENQSILGATLRGMIDLLGRSANSQQGIAKGLLDVVNRRRYDKGQDYEFNPNMNPEANIIYHKFPEIPQSAYNMLMLQNQEAEALTGVKSFSGGMSGESYGDVAAGIRGVLDAASKREMAILRRLAKGITDIGNKLIAMNSEFLSEKEIVRVTNSEFVTIKREDLVGNFDLIVDISTAEIDNAKSQDLGFMLQTIGPNLDFEITKHILVEISRLKRMPTLAETLHRFKPTPDPLVEQAKQLEVLKLQKEIELIDSQIIKNKAQSVKAEAEADRVGLDTIEQETGTKHERDLEKQEAQSAGNQKLEVTKALLKAKKLGETDPDIEAAIGWNDLSRKMPSSKDRPSMNGQNLPKEDPRLSINSKYFDPSQDPALNPNINI